MIKRFCFFISFISLFCNTVKASVTEFEIPLISYHINNSQTFKAAPNKVDNNAVFVLNPGFLLGLDTRKDTKTSGFSFLAKGGFLQDCANKTAYILGGGAKYRYFFSNKFSFDLNGYVMVANAVVSFSSNETLCSYNSFGGQTCQNVKGNNKREFATLPLVNVGFNYHLKSNKSVGTTFSYIPKNTAIAATSGTDLLFLTINFAF